MSAATRRAEVVESGRRRGIPARLGRLMGIAAAVIAAAGIALVPATAASAHDYLVSSSPAANATVSDSLSSVALTFDDVVLDEGGRGALIQVTDASGRNFETGCASVQGRTVSAPVALGAPGTYRVTWQIVSADGHPVSDSLQFTYKGPKAGGGHAGPLPKCGAAASAPRASAPGAAAPASVSHTTVVIITVAGGIVLLAIIAVVIVLALSARGRKRE
jgi:methionine-rich copper-binding protein CopC